MPRPEIKLRRLLRVVRRVRRKLRDQVLEAQTQLMDAPDQMAIDPVRVNERPWRRAGEFPEGRGAPPPGRKRAHAYNDHPLAADESQKLARREQDPRRRRQRPFRDNDLRRADSEAFNRGVPPNGEGLGNRLDDSDLN